MKIASRPQLVLVVAWLLALLLNGAFALLRPGGSPDSARYEQIALNLAQGHGYSASAAPPYRPDIFRAPLYPAFLAAVYRVAGHHPGAVRLIQALLLSCVVPLTYVVARPAFGEPTALLSAALSALYPYFWSYSGQLLSEGLAIAVAAGALALLAWSVGGAAWWVTAAAGVALGVLCLVKPAMLLFPAAAAVAYGLRQRPGGHWVRLTALYAAGAAVVVCPWSIRNFAATGRFVPVASGGGLMLYAAAAGAAHGYDLNEFHQRVQLGDWRVQREQHDDDPAVVLALDDQFRAEAVRLIAAHPLSYARHALTALGRVWISASMLRGGRWLISWPHAAASSALLAAALAGFMAHRRAWRQAIVPLVMIGYLSLAHAPFGTEARQSLPGRTCLLMGAAALLVTVAGRWRAGRGLPEEEGSGP